MAGADPGPCCAGVARGWLWPWAREATDSLAGFLLGFLLMTLFLIILNGKA